MPIQMQKKAGQQAGAGAGKQSGAPAGQRGAMAEGSPVSLRPSDQVSEGLLDDCDVTFESFIFTLEAPPNYNAGDAVPLFVKASLAVDGGETVEQWWSAGDSSKFQPSEDGDTAVRVKGSGGLGQGTNAAALFRSIVDAGFPEDKITAGLSCFVGMNAHMQQVAMNRKGLPAQEGKRPSTTLLVAKINRLPWEQAGKVAPKGKAATSTKTTPATRTAPAASNGDVTDDAAAIIATILAKGPCKSASLPAKAFPHLAGKANRADILNLLKDADFLVAASEAGHFQFDGETVSANE
jgi:hypothetical protein